jgi:hypothetical protein
MPVRFTSPSLAGIGNPQLQAHHWQLDVAYRHLGADRWYVGTQVQESSAPFGKPLFLNINSVDLSVDYGLTDRTALRLTLPFSYGTHSRYYADGRRHVVSAGGLGDLNVFLSHWLFDFGPHAKGNIAFGIGVKMPTGNNAADDDFFLADGSVLQRPVDQSIQLGDGGWGLTLGFQAFRWISKGVSAYAQGWYLASPREKTNVPSPLPGVPLSVPDVYSARLGGSYVLLPKAGISLSLGPRIDGIPRRDLIGGDAGFRRPGYSLYIEPGFTMARGRGTLTVIVPVLVHKNFERSLADIQMQTTGGGDLARYLFLTGYSWRF